MHFGRLTLPCILATVVVVTNCFVIAPHRLADRRHLPSLHHDTANLADVTHDPCSGTENENPSTCPSENEFSIIPRSLSRPQARTTVLDETPIRGMTNVVGRYQGDCESVVMTNVFVGPCRDGVFSCSAEKILHLMRAPRSKRQTTLSSAPGKIIQQKSHRWALASQILQISSAIHAGKSTTSTTTTSKKSKPSPSYTYSTTSVYVVVIDQQSTVTYTTTQTSRSVSTKLSKFTDASGITHTSTHDIIKTRIYVTKVSQSKYTDSSGSTHTSDLVSTWEDVSTTVTVVTAVSPASPTTSSKTTSSDTTEPTKPSFHAGISSKLASLTSDPGLKSLLLSGQGNFLAAATTTDFSAWATETDDPVVQSLLSEIKDFFGSSHGIEPSGNLLSEVLGYAQITIAPATLTNPAEATAYCLTALLVPAMQESCSKSPAGLEKVRNCYNLNNANSNGQFPSPEAQQWVEWCNGPTKFADKPYAVPEQYLQLYSDTSGNMFTGCNWMNDYVDAGLNEQYLETYKLFCVYVNKMSLAPHFYEVGFDMCRDYRALTASIDAGFTVPPTLGLDLPWSGVFAQGCCATLTPPLNDQLKALCERFVMTAPGHFPSWSFFLKLPVYSSIASAASAFEAETSSIGSRIASISADVSSLSSRVSATIESIVNQVTGNPVAGDLASYVNSITSSLLPSTTPPQPTTSMQAALFTPVQIQVGQCTAHFQEGCM